MKHRLSAALAIFAALIILAPISRAQETADGDTAGKNEEKEKGGASSSFTITWPDLTWDGGEWKWEGEGDFPCGGEHCPHPVVGSWTGGRLGIMTMPLSDRLVRMTDHRDVPGFDDYMIMTGARTYVSVGGGLRIGVFFDTGFQSRDARVDGDHRRADVNVTRLGMAFESMAPLPMLKELENLMDIPLLKGFDPAGQILLGLGLEMGAGNLNLAMRGDDIGGRWRDNEPFLFFSPTFIASVPVTHFLRADFYVGWQFVTMNNFSVEYYLGEQEAVKGTQFDGAVVGVNLLFGFDDWYELWRKEAPPK